MRITFIRHTSVDVEPGICYGCSDVGLASTFKEEAYAVKSSIEGEIFDAVYSSPLTRCVKLSGYCGYSTPILDECLKELNFGSWEMQKWDNITGPEITAWYDDWINQPAG